MNGFVSKFEEMNCTDAVVKKEKINFLDHMGGGDRFNQFIAKVEGSAKLFVEPDVIEFFFKISTSKDTADEAKKSIAKRVEYLLQTIRSSKIKGDRNIITHEMLNKNEDHFEMSAEILVKCDSLQKYEELRNVIIEKLEGAVYVSSPRFYHSTKCLQDARVRVVRMAVSNARAKAVEMAQASQQSAGNAIFIQEVSCTVNTPRELEHTFRDAISFQAYKYSRILHSSVLVAYELLREKTVPQSQ